MAGHRRLPIFVALAIVATAFCLAAARGDQDDASWTPLDIAAGMNSDIILTPNESYRCWDLGEQGGGGNQPPQVFGGHNVGYFWGCVTYVLEGGTYQIWQPGKGIVPLTVPAGAGLPPDGRVGAYRLYVDELEHPQWSTSTTIRSVSGRNAVMLAKTGSKGPEPLRIPLTSSQRRRYDAIRFLMVSRIGNPQHHGVNIVRLVAEYADKSYAELWEGTVGYPFGNSDRNNGRDHWKLPADQKEAIRMTCFAEAAGNMMRMNEVEAEPLVLIEFAKALPLDAAKNLEAILIENADDKSNTRWEVYILAASARAAGN